MAFSTQSIHQSHQTHESHDIQRIFMTLLELAHEKGLTPKRVATTQGGEYHSACPACGGTDRFILQPSKQMKNCVGYYFCRQCGIHGDSIQFAREFLNCANFKDAVERVGATVPDTKERLVNQKLSKPMIIDKPSEQWMQQAKLLVEKSHACLLTQMDILQYLDRRGLPEESVKRYKLGWLSQDEMLDGHLWGLEKGIWLFAGILIPTMENQNIIRLKIRRKDVQQDNPKYIAITESMSGLTIVGDKKKQVMIVVESELDAYALHHVVGDFAVIIAVGGNIKKPDPQIAYMAYNRTLLICHDNDDAGKHMWERWKALYAHAQAYPTPKGKDVGEAIEQGFDIRLWIIESLPINVQRDLNLIKREWSAEEKELLDWIAHFISERTVTRYAYKIFEQEIALGPDSSRARSGELQTGLRLMKYLVEAELKTSSTYSSI